MTEKEQAAMSRKIDISENVLRWLYYDEELSQRAIAQRFSCSDRTIRNRMAEFGMPARPTNVPGRNRRVHIPKEMLEQLYYDEGLNQYEIADRLGCSQAVVYRRMAEYELEARRRLPQCVVPESLSLHNGRLNWPTLLG